MQQQVNYCDIKGDETNDEGEAGGYEELCGVGLSPLVSDIVPKQTAGVLV